MSHHSYLFYELELPVEPEEPQREFHIQKEGQNDGGGGTDRGAVRRNGRTGGRENEAASAGGRQLNRLEWPIFV